MTNDQATPTSNGSVPQEHIAQNLTEEITVGYRPQTPLETMWLGGVYPQITLRRDIEFMQMHPIVINALEYYKAGIAGAKFWGGPDHRNPNNKEGKPISMDERVNEFVLAHCTRFWQRGVPFLQDGAYPYGWAAAEHVYKEVSGMMIWSHLKDFHPTDAFILTLKYQPVGVRIKNIREKLPVDLHLASKTVPAKGCWYPHRPRFSQLYGRSQFTGAWIPWRRLGFKDGVEQVIDAAVYRAGYSGPVGRYPPGHSAPTAQSGIPSTRVDGGGLPRRENRDVMRQILEWAKAGASFALSSEQYPQAQGGGPKWDVQFPDHVMDVSPLVNTAAYLEDQIMLGIGVPPELVRAGGTGSGYSGRSIPREAFLDGQQKIADAMLQLFVEQVIRPLVLWNFGDVPFEVSCKSLLESQAENKQGGVEEPLPQPNDQEQPQDPNQQPPGNEPPQQPLNNSQPPVGLSMDQTMREKVMKIIGRISRSAA